MTEPAPPIRLSGNESTRAVWTGRDVVYVVPSGVIADRAALAFDPELHTWVRFEAPFLPGSFGTVGLVRAGDTAAALEWNAKVPHVDAELRWSRRQVPPAPWVPGPRALRHPSICSIEASPVPGGAVVSCDVGNLVGIDFTTGTWSTFPRPPRRLLRSAVWTGHQLSAFDGQ